VKDVSIAGDTLINMVYPGSQRAQQSCKDLGTPLNIQRNHSIFPNSGQRQHGFVWAD